MVFAHRTIESVWRRQSVWARIGWIALTPFSLAFSLAVRTRNVSYDLGILPTVRVPLSIISIGNLTVGGTGKTPLTLWLAQALQQRGHTVGIITRGYKGTATSPTLAGRYGTPLVTSVEVGDEAIMLARRFAGVVITGRDRVAAATFAHQHFALDVAILDDGFQHRRLHREVDVLLISAQGPKNSWLLPAGPFREPLTSMRRAQAIVLSKRTGAQEYSPSLFFARNPQSSIPNPQSPIPAFHAELVPTALVQVLHGQWLEQPLSVLSGKRVIAVTGIANPQPFYHSIREQGAELTRVVEFPDHHSYTHSEWQQLVRDSDSCDVLLTTEKDLVKLERFSPAVDRLRALRVQLQLEPAETFLTTIEQHLRSRKRDRTDNGRTISHQSSHRPAH